MREPAKMPFVEVELPLSCRAASAVKMGLEVRLGDGTVLRGGSAAELARLVKALRA